MKVELIPYEPSMFTMGLTFMIFIVPFMFAFKYFNIHIISLLGLLAILFYIKIYFELKEEGPHVVLNENELVVHNERINFDDIMDYNYLIDHKQKIDMLASPFDKEVKMYLNIRLKNSESLLLSVNNPIESDSVLINNIDDIFRKLKIVKRKNEKLK